MRGNGLRVVCVEPPEPQELKSFLHVVYRALMMVCRYLEKTYGF
jgi:hypothetical protein